MSAETLRKAITRSIWDTSSMAFTALWVNCLTSEETISSARIQASASPTVRRAERILSPIPMPPPWDVTTTHPPHGTRRGKTAAAYCQERSAGSPFPWVTERAGGWAHLPRPRPLRKGLDLNRAHRGRQQHRHSSGRPNSHLVPKRRRTSPELALHSGSDQPTFPDQRHVHPEVRGWDLKRPRKWRWSPLVAWCGKMQKKVVEGEGKASGWVKWWGKKSSPFDASIYCSVAAVSESLGALRPEFLRTAVPRHSVEGYIRRRGGWSDWGGVLLPGSLRRAQPFPESALRPVPPLRLSRTLEPPPPTWALSSACQFPASPETLLLSPASPLPLLLLSLESPGSHCPAAPVTGGDHTPRQRHGPDSANSFSGASSGAVGRGSWGLWRRGRSEGRSGSLSPSQKE